MYPIIAKFGPITIYSYGMVLAIAGAGTAKVLDVLSSWACWHGAGIKNLAII